MNLTVWALGIVQKQLPQVPWEEMAPQIGRLFLHGPLLISRSSSFSSYGTSSLRSWY